MFGVFFLLNLLSIISVTFALQNVTVDDTDASIVYVGNWEPSSRHPSPLDYGGSHTLSDDTAAIATFTFTGVAVYYLAPKWPYAVNTRIALDGQTPTTVNLTDSTGSSNTNLQETIQYDVVWSATGLTNGPHKVEVTRGLYAIVDGFIYTVPDGTSTTAAVSPSDPSSMTSSGPSSTSSASPKKSLSLGVILGISIPVAVLVVTLLALIILCAKKTRNKGAKPDEKRGPFTIPPSGPTTDNSSFPLLNGAEGGRIRGSMGTASPPSSPGMRQYPNPNIDPSQTLANVHRPQPNNQIQPGLTYSHPFGSDTFPHTNIGSSPGRASYDVPASPGANAANAATVGVNSYVQPLPQSPTSEGNGPEQVEQPESIPPPYNEIVNSQGQSSAPAPTSPLPSPNPESYPSASGWPEKDEEVVYSSGQGGQGGSWRASNDRA